MATRMASVRVICVAGASFSATLAGELGRSLASNAMGASCGLSPRLPERKAKPPAVDKATTKRAPQKMTNRVRLASMAFKVGSLAPAAFHSKDGMCFRQIHGKMPQASARSRYTLVSPLDPISRAHPLISSCRTLIIRKPRRITERALATDSRQNRLSCGMCSEVGTRAVVKAMYGVRGDKRSTANWSRNHLPPSVMPMCSSVDCIKPRAFSFSSALRTVCPLGDSEVV